MKTLAAAFLLVALPCSAWACTGIVRLNAPNEGVDGTVPVTKGRKIKDLDHILRDPTNKVTLACAGETCFLAQGQDRNGKVVEVIDLSACTIAASSTTSVGLERHEIEPFTSDLVEEPQDRPSTSKGKE